MTAYLNQIQNENGVPIYYVICNSEDESEILIATNFQKVKWINSGYNAGFARANNVGIREIQNRLCLRYFETQNQQRKVCFDIFNDSILLHFNINGRFCN